MRQKWGEVARNFVPRPFGTACRRRSLQSPNSLREFKSHASRFFINKKLPKREFFIYGGWGEIRTHELRKESPVFKTGAFNRSATHPQRLHSLIF